MDTVASEVLHCNRQAITHLRTNQFPQAFKHLQKAKTLLRSVADSTSKERLRVVTLNNLGCYYRKHSRPKLALQHLEEALKSDLREGRDVLKLAGTHLNVCAIKSQLGDHEAALSHAKTALSLLTSSDLGESPDLSTTLALAYHSSGVEQEYIKEKFAAAEAYLTGMKLAREKLGNKHAVTQALTESYMSITGGTASTARPLLQPLRLTSLSPGKLHKPISPWSARPMQQAQDSPLIRRQKTASRGRLPQSRKSLKSQVQRRLSPGEGTWRRGNTGSPESDQRKADILQRNGMESSEGLQRQRSPDTELRAKHAILELEKLKAEATQESRLNSAIPATTLTRTFRKTFLRHRPAALFPIPEAKSRCIPRVTKLQALVRGFLARRRYHRFQLAVRKIQKVVRGSQVRSLYERIRAAIVFIQRVWRKYKGSRKKEGGRV